MYSALRLTPQSHICFLCLSCSIMDETKLIRVEREACKLVYARGQTRDAIDTLSGSIYTHTINTQQHNKVCMELTARCDPLLKITYITSMVHAKYSEIGPNPHFSGILL